MGGVLARFPEYWKAAIAALAPVFLVVQAAVTDDRITAQEWVGIAAAVVVAAGVLAKGNADPPPVKDQAAEDERLTQLGPGAPPTGNFRVMDSDDQP